jgi:hypothetical protein
MSYETAPATIMLASHCAACARPLVDAKSVELGIGPDCRAKYGYDLEGVSDEAREKANRLVRECALKQEGYDVLEAVWQLCSLGFERLAARIMDRAARIRIVVDGGSLRVYTPYSEEAVFAWRQVPGRRFMKEGRTCFNLVHQDSKAWVWNILKTFFAGEYGYHTETGPFMIPEAGERKGPKRADAHPAASETEAA